MFRDNRVVALLLAAGLVAAYFRYDPAEIFAATLQDENVTGCDGRTLHLSGPEAELLRLHNEARIERGIAPLCVQEQLIAVAREHSEDMLSRGYYSHDTPEGTEPSERVAAGYAYSLMAENIHMRSASYGKQSAGEMEEVFTDWMESPGHRENLLNPALHEVGIGVATGQYGSEPDYTSLYTVDFGTPRQ